jgi:hypothetical protein
MLDLKTKILIKKKLEIIDLAGEQAIFDFETGRYSFLRGSADAIWEYISDNMTVAELADAIIKDFEIDKETCLEAICDFISGLEKENFIELAKSEQAD